MRELAISLLLGTLMMGTIFLAVNPYILIGANDGEIIRSLQSEFSNNCECQGYEYSRSQAQYQTSEKDDYSEYLARMSSGRSLWEINEDIRDILKKYPLVPSFLFTDSCNKVPADNE